MCCCVVHACVFVPKPSVLGRMCQFCESWQDGSCLPAKLQRVLQKVPAHALAWALMAVWRHRCLTGPGAAKGYQVPGRSAAVGLRIVCRHTRTPGSGSPTGGLSHDGHSAAQGALRCRSWSPQQPPSPFSTAPSQPLTRTGMMPCPPGSRTTCLQLPRSSPGTSSRLCTWTLPRQGHSAACLCRPAA